MAESATLAVAGKAAELRRQGVDVVDWSAGEPDFGSPAGAVAAAVEALKAGRTRYTANTGIVELRDAIAGDLANRYRAPWNSSQVVVTVGAKAALFELAIALLSAGDEVILPSPYWVTLPAQINLADGEVVDAPARMADGFRLSAEQVLEKVSPRTKAVLLNSPSNPTGAVISQADLRRIVETCAERDIYLIADETYERFVYDGEAFPSAAALAAEFPETVILVGSFSKTHAMTGWRLGYLLGPDRVVKAVSKVQSHATSNPTTFAMWGAVAAFDDAEDRVKKMLDEYQARRDLLLTGLNDIAGIECATPGGAFYAFPKVSDHYRDGLEGSTAFASFLLESGRIAVVPGAAFGADDHVRISFACATERLREGLDRLRAVLA